MPWLRMFWIARKQKVYAQLDASGRLLQEGGRVKIRFKLSDEREYSTSPSALNALPDEEPQLDPQELRDQRDFSTTSAEQSVEAAAALMPPTQAVRVWTSVEGSDTCLGLACMLAHGEHRRLLWDHLVGDAMEEAQRAAILMGLDAIKDTARPVQLILGFELGKHRVLLDAEVERRGFTSIEVAKDRASADAVETRRIAARAAIERSHGDRRFLRRQASSQEPQATQEKTTKGIGARIRVVERPGNIPDTPKAGEILAFTDGACQGNPGPAGLGVVIQDGREVIEISEYLGRGTNNIAELSAILRALERITNSEREVHLYTDSSYAIGVLAKGWKAKANPELIERVKRELSRFSKLTLYKVKGHAGHALNERVDALARDAVSKKGAR
ncbi:MAG: ribonuclease H [Myxococcota bacterium]|jgi:ribonuclease HI|nr:ribonuclease H [Myxococcota bacterium]